MGQGGGVAAPPPDKQAGRLEIANAHADELLRGFATITAQIRNLLDNLAGAPPSEGAETRANEIPHQSQMHRLEQTLGGLRSVLEELGQQRSRLHEL